MEFTQISITFPQEKCYQYKVEVSDNRKVWILVENDMHNREKETFKEIRLTNKKLHGRFVRITFRQSSEGAPALAEVVVKGTVCE